MYHFELESNTKLKFKYYMNTNIVVVVFVVVVCCCCWGRVLLSSKDRMETAMRVKTPFREKLRYHIHRQPYFRF